MDYVITAAVSDGGKGRFTRRRAARGFIFSACGLRGLGLRAKQLCAAA